MSAFSPPPFGLFALAFFIGGTLFGCLFCVLVSLPPASSAAPLSWANPDVQELTVNCPPQCISPAIKKAPP